MTQITIDSEELSKAFDEIWKSFRKRLPPSVNDDEELWTSDQCAAYLGIGNTESFTQYTACLPSFPDRIELPTARNKERRSIRWVAAEVKEWALSHRRKKKA